MFRHPLMASVLYTQHIYVLYKMYLIILCTYNCTDNSTIPQPGRGFQIIFTEEINDIKYIYSSL